MNYNVKELTELNGKKVIFESGIAEQVWKEMMEQGEEVSEVTVVINEKELFVSFEYDYVTDEQISEELNKIAGELGISTFDVDPTLDSEEKAKVYFKTLFEDDMYFLVATMKQYYDKNNCWEDFPNYLISKDLESKGFGSCGGATFDNYDPDIDETKMKAAVLKTSKYVEYIENTKL